MNAIVMERCGLFVPSSLTYDLSRAAGVSCYLSAQKLAGHHPTSEPIPLAEARERAGLVGPPWVVVHHASVGEELFCASRIVVYATFETALAAARGFNGSIAAHTASPTRWVARSFPDHIRRARSKVAALAEMLQIAEEACAAPAGPPNLLTPAAGGPSL